MKKDILITIKKAIDRLTGKTIIQFGPPRSGTTLLYNILKDVFNQAKVITVDKIQNVVSNYFNIPLSDMLSQRRSRPLARPRQLAMYLAKKMTTRSLPEIGRRFANRDHTTVIHAVKTITRLSEQDDEMKKNINQIKNLLQE